VIILKFQNLAITVRCVMICYKKSVDTIDECFFKLFGEAYPAIKRDTVRTIMEI
jgi:hypothetical protein